MIVANEVIKTRSGILAENAIKWGNVNLVVTNNDPKDFQRLQGYFDMIVIDALQWQWHVQERQGKLLKNGRCRMWSIAAKDNNVFLKMFGGT